LPFSAVRAAFQIKAEVDVFGEIVLEALPRQVGGIRRAPGTENEINPNQCNRHDYHRSNQ
jgi:hypothetical protein